MYSFKLCAAVFSTKVLFKKSLFFSMPVRYYNGKIDTVAKRASMLKTLINNKDKDKRKHWHLELMPSKPKVRVFEKIHRPQKRRAVLNSLFIKNISDVISTGDLIPDIEKYGVEITGVQISPCMKILNVFWQVASSHYDSCDEIGQLLNTAAPRMRAELISRNVLGRVPLIFFLRDATNERISAFEQAMKKLESEPKSDPSMIVDDSFTEDLYSFKQTKTNNKYPEYIEKASTKQVENREEEQPATPNRPIDMKCDVFGLDHSILLEKVLAIRKKRKNPPQNTAVISPESLNDANDLFSKIPGVCFQSDEQSRDDILKQFHLERKMLKEKKTVRISEDIRQCDDDDDEAGDDIQFDSSDYDFVEEETTEKSQ